MNGLVSKTFTLEQKYGFKLERNKDLTFIVIIIDIDWYENNYRDNFWGHIAQPYWWYRVSSQHIRRPYYFRNAENADRISESSYKNGIYSLARNVTEFVKV